ncbi:MAG TPA: TolC family protein [Bryobacteraceae bacterium]|jgi:outer membrane protein TolC
MMIRMILWAAAGVVALGQVTPAPPLTLTLKDAQMRGAENAPQLLAAMSDSRAAHEDLVQARSAGKPGVSVRSDYLGTQGNGTFASGRYVTNDGVHVYREWAVVHQDFNAALLKTGVEKASVVETMARLKAEIARRGVAATVTKAYYGLLASQRKYATAQEALDQAKRSLGISQDLERGGEAAHSDVVKSDLQVSKQDQVFREAKLAMENARLDLAVLLFRDLDENFSIVDDLSLAPALPEFTEVQTLAGTANPYILLANNALRSANLDVAMARQAYLPSLTADLAYGIEANAFALHSTVAADPGKGPQPNLGYFLTVSLTLPVWDWGARASKVKQADLKREQAKVELSATQRELIRNLRGFYSEAQTAKEQVDSLKHGVDLAAESLRLNGLRYQAGEASILELVDAQSTLTDARNAYDDGLVRYRLAVANLQTLTGTF